MNSLFSPFNLPNVISCQIRFFGEFFLAQTYPHSLISNCFTQDLI